MSVPKVSVIIPTYNRAAYLELTLRSVVGQSLESIEVIVVDDGSPNEDTAKICEQFNKVSYFKINNSGGPATPRNYGIKKARGEYIAFVDDDDIWLPGKLEAQVAVLEKNPDYGLVHCYCQVIDEHGVLQETIVGKPGKPNAKHGDVKLRMIGNWTLMMPTPLIRRSVIEDVGYFNETIPPALEDVEYWSRCAFHTKFYYQDKALVEYRIHSGNISASREKYLDLPLYLKAITKSYYKSGVINPLEYKTICNNICSSQAKHIKTNMFKTLYNLCVLNPFWIVNFRVLKVMIKKLIS